MKILLLTALAPILWGTTYITTTEFLPPDQPILVALLRSLPIGILITLLYRTLPKGHWWWRAFVLGALNIGLFFALLFVAAYRLPGGMVATIGALQPLIIMALSKFVLQDRVPPLAVGAGLLGIIGVAFLVFSPNGQLDWVGILAAVAGMLLMSVGVVLTKRWGSPVDLLPFTAWQLTAGGIVLLPIMLIFEPTLPTFTVTNIFGFLWLGVIGTGLAYWLWFRGIKSLRPFQISFLGLFSPMVAVILGYAFLDQGFALRQWMGIGLILVSIILAQSTQYLPIKFTKISIFLDRVKLKLN